MLPNDSLTIANKGEQAKVEDYDKTIDSIGINSDYKGQKRADDQDHNALYQEFQTYEITKDISPSYIKVSIKQNTDGAYAYLKQKQ